MDELVSVVDGLVAEADVGGVDGRELGCDLVVLERVEAQLAAFKARLTVAFAASGGWAEDGSGNVAAWLAQRTGRSARDTRADVGLARRLVTMPATADALAAGEIGVARARRLARLNTPARAADFADAEEMLVGQAKTLEWPEFERAMAYWHQLADPDGSEQDAARDEDLRRVHLSEGMNGTGVLDGLLTPLGRATVRGSLDRIEQELFEADWAEARARLGDAATVDALRRSAAQRRHDALCEMARRAQTAPAGGKRPLPFVSILVGYETFAGRICQLADGTVLAPGTVAGLLDEALIERAVFSLPNRIESLSETRLFTGALRRQVQLAQQFCTHPGCHRPAEHCEVDHIRAWEHDGSTVQENAALLCAAHHRYRHRTDPQPPARRRPVGEPGPPDTPGPARGPGPTGEPAPTGQPEPANAADPTGDPRPAAKSGHGSAGAPPSPPPAAQRDAAPPPPRAAEPPDSGDPPNCCEPGFPPDDSPEPQHAAPPQSPPDT